MSHTQPPWRTKHECTVGVDWDPPVTLPTWAGWWAIREPARALRGCMCFCSVDVVGFTRLEKQILSHRTHSICARALREFIFSELPQHHHTFTFTSTTAPLNQPCSRRKFYILWLWPRRLSHLPTTSTRSLRRTCNGSPRRHSFHFYMHQVHNHINDPAHLSLLTSIWKSEMKPQL